MKLAQPLLYLVIRANSLKNLLGATALATAWMLSSTAVADSAFGYGDAVVEKEQIDRPATTRIETFRGLDKNRDGVLNRLEMRDSPRYAAWRVMDRNRDGKISSREYSDFRAHRERSLNLNSASNTEVIDYGDPYLNSRLRKNTEAPKRSLSEPGAESDSHYEEVLRKSNLERERRKTPVGY